MGELGVITLEDGQPLFIEVEELPPEEETRLKSMSREAPRRGADLPPGAEPTSTGGGGSR